MPGPVGIQASFFSEAKNLEELRMGFIEMVNFDFLKFLPSIRRVIAYDFVNRILNLVGNHVLSFDSLQGDTGRSYTIVVSDLAYESIEDRRFCNVKNWSSVKSQLQD